MITLKKFNDHGNDNLRSSRMQNKLEKGLLSAKAGLICYTSMGCLSLNKLELNCALSRAVSLNDPVEPSSNLLIVAIRV